MSQEPTCSGIESSCWRALTVTFTVCQGVVQSASTHLMLRKYTAEQWPTDAVKQRSLTICHQLVTVWHTMMTSGATSNGHTLL